MPVYPSVVTAATARDGETSDCAPGRREKNGHNVGGTEPDKHKTQNCERRSGTDCGYQKADGGADGPSQQDPVATNAGDDAITGQPPERHRQSKG